MNIFYHSFNSLGPERMFGLCDNFVRPTLFMQAMLVRTHYKQTLRVLLINARVAQIDPSIDRPWLCAEWNCELYEVISRTGLCVRACIHSDGT